MIDIAGYRVIELIGRGATASVYHAVQLSLEREVAIKVLHPELAADARAARRFLDEARLLAGINHPHVASVWDVGVSETGLHYFSMRHLPDGDLAGRIAAGPVGSEALSRIVFGIAKALEYIHARGLVHRDVTPGNILFDRAGAAYLTDFGVARSLVGAQAAAMADLAPGVVRYSSPEQLRGATMDHRADLYSLGVLTYEALSGATPFPGDDPFEIAYDQVFAPVPALPVASSRWQPLIDQALAKLPESRIPSATAFAAMVERCAPEHVSGLNQIIRAPHFDHIRTVRPEDSPIPRLAAPLPSPSDLMATHISNRPFMERMVERSTKVGGRRAFIALSLATAAVIAGIAFWLALDLIPSGDGGTREAAVSEPAAVQPRPVPTPVPAIEPDEPDPDPDPAEIEVLPEDVDPSTLPTVTDPVADLTRRGRALLAARRLMLPEGDSAHDVFRLALSIDPTAPGAQRGLADVGSAYLALASEALTLDERLDFWNRGLQATEGVIPAEAVRDQIRAARQAERDIYLAQGKAALARWDGEAATRAFELALKVDGQAPGAAQGIDEATRVGRPGYGFADALSNGGKGPELVIVSSYALALNPVTVAEFRRFWRDQGNAFEGGRPACRDRESGWRASRRRTWEAPGFEQGEDHPVVCVGYSEAESYVRWLSERSGQRYRLPRPSEWLSAYAGPAACNGANRGDQSFRQKHGGRDAQPCDDGHAETSPVRRFAAVGVGLYDMDGNVREWSMECAVEGRDGCRERLALGSAWLSVDEPEPTQRAMSSEVAFNSVGFRVLREIQ